MITNSIGILLYTFFYGKKVGEDRKGNKFYVHKNIENRKWVLYKISIDPTILDVEWQLWLTDKNNNIVPFNKNNNLVWQKQKEANATGTIDAYHPGHGYKNNDSVKDINKKNSSWDPNK